MIPTFEAKLSSIGASLKRGPVEVLQVNVGKLCNQACLHCHVEAGPKRKEIMTEKTAQRVVELLRQSTSVHTLDLTGGAPELNPHFRFLVREARALGKTVIDRCNLTILFEPGQEDTARFLRDQRVEVVASLPCYSKENVDQQRGNGVFEKSITALRNLNELGFGRAESGLKLHLVYNPGGAFLPPAQAELEAEYKVELREMFGIEFNRLFTITNMPIKRFRHDLIRSGKLDEYMSLLENHFNPAAVPQLMCLNMVSVGWDGLLFDCDFNQMLEIKVKKSGSSATGLSIWDIQGLSDLEGEAIATANHCYGCTAGAGSSCGGALSS